jgi:hypothetical protein
MGILEILAVILVVLWLGGFAFHIAGNFIHILLIIAVVVLVLRFIGGGF